MVRDRGLADVAAGGEVAGADLRGVAQLAKDRQSRRVGGGLEDEIDVSIDQQKLARLGIDVNDVITRLKNENVNASGGRIEEGSQRYLVRTVNQFKTLDEMRELLIKLDGSVPIRLKDIADVHQGFKEREGIVRIDGREAIELAIYKEGDGNTVNRTEGIAFAGGAAFSSEEGYFATKVMRSLGVIHIEQQARV